MYRRDPRGMPRENMVANALEYRADLLDSAVLGQSMKSIAMRAKAEELRRETPTEEANES